MEVGDSYGVTKLQEEEINVDSVEDDIIRPILKDGIIDGLLYLILSDEDARRNLIRTLRMLRRCKDFFIAASCWDRVTELIENLTEEDIDSTLGKSY